MLGETNKVNKIISLVETVVHKYNKVWSELKFK